MSTCDLSISVLPVPSRCVVVVPNNVRAAVKGPLAEVVLASMATFTVMLLTPAPMRHSECTAPLALLSAIVVASVTRVPAPLNVNRSRVKTVPGPPLEIEVVPMYVITVPDEVECAKISPPLGCVPVVGVPVPFISSPIGTVNVGTLLFLMPM
jgi:hypothetical protein